MLTELFLLGLLNNILLMFGLNRNSCVLLNLITICKSICLEIIMRGDLVLIQLCMISYVMWIFSYYCCKTMV